MVKGISKQIILVKAPDTKLFEQAIFILREEALGEDGMTDRDILEEACKVADNYVRSKANPGKFIRKWHLDVLAYLAAGALAMALVWVVTSLV